MRGGMVAAGAVLMLLSLFGWMLFFLSPVLGICLLILSPILFIVGLIVLIVGLVSSSPQPVVYMAPPVVVPAAAPAPAACPACGRILTWVARYGRWYCPNERKYL